MRYDEPAAVDVWIEWEWNERVQRDERYLGFDKWIWNNEWKQRLQRRGPRGSGRRGR